MDPAICAVARPQFHIRRRLSCTKRFAGLTSAIPTPTPFTGIHGIAKRQYQLPNGTIVNPTGQVVGQAGATASVGPTAFVNPYDQYTGTAKVQKIFNGGIVTLGASVQQVDYENAGTAQPNFTNKTFH